VILNPCHKIVSRKVRSERINILNCLEIGINMMYVVWELYLSDWKDYDPNIKSNSSSATYTLFSNCMNM
jgi:hypothetical protein